MTGLGGGARMDAAGGSPTRGDPSPIVETLGPLDTEVFDITDKGASTPTDSPKSSAKGFEERAVDAGENTSTGLTGELWADFFGEDEPA